MFVETGSLMHPKKSKFSHYPKSFISQVLKELEEGASQKELKAKYQIPATTLSEWLNKFGGSFYEASKRKQVPSSKKKQVIRAVQQNRMTRKEAALYCKVNVGTIRYWLKKCSTDSEIDSFAENEMQFAGQSSQQKELAAAQLKIRALETLIDIAEEKFKIAIRKKPGAKQ